MAFFGVTLLGCQNPIGDKLIVKASHLLDGGDLRSGPPPCLQERHGPLLYSTDIHHGSHRRYKEMLKLAQVPRSPDQLYTTPLTDSQQYGWMTPRSPEPWTQVKRFPRKCSGMTKFVEEMLAADRENSLF
ncbi:spmip11 [Pungitius sinensis]